MKTKRLVTLAVTFLITIAAMAQQAVTLSDFYQYRYGSATATLCNNTEKSIHKVSFRIVYYDMDGKQLDYKDFSEVMDIDPGMSKGVEIEAFRDLDRYVYCDQLTNHNYENYKGFKVGFQLKAIDGVASKDQTVQQLKPANENKSSDDETSDSKAFCGLTMGFGLLIGIILLALSSGWFVAVYLLARLYHQNPWIWVLASFVLSPIISFILILIFGNRNRHHDSAEEQDDRWEH